MLVFSSHQSTVERGCERIKSSH